MKNVAYYTLLKAFGWFALLSFNGVAMEMQEDPLVRPLAQTLTDLHLEENDENTDTLISSLDSKSDCSNSEWLLYDDSQDDQAAESQKVAKKITLMDYMGHVYDLISDSKHLDHIANFDDLLKTWEFKKIERWKILTMIAYVNPTRFPIFHTLIDELLKGNKRESVYISTFSAFLESPAEHCYKRSAFMEEIVDYSIPHLKGSACIKAFDFVRQTRRFDVDHLKSAFNFVKSDHFLSRDFESVLLLTQAYAHLSSENYQTVSKVFQPLTENSIFYNNFCRLLGQFSDVQLPQLLKPFSDNNLVYLFKDKIYELFVILNKIVPEQRIFILNNISKTYAPDQWLWQLKKYVDLSD